MPKVSNKDIYAQDPNLDMEDYLLGTNYNSTNKKTQTYSLSSIFSLFYNFLGYNAFLFTTDTDTYPIASPGCFFAFDEDNEITSDFQQTRKLTFSSNDTYNFNVTEYLQMLVDSDKFLFKLINLEDKNNFIFLKPRNFTLSNTLTSFDVNIEIQYGLSNGNFVNYKKYLLLLEFDANTFDPADYDLTDFTNTSGNPFVTSQDLTNALSLLPSIITNHSDLNLDDGTNPHGTTKSDVGLSNVDNTSDIDKPISTATQEALDEINSTLNPDRIISLGTETIDENEYTYEGYVWQLGGVQLNNIGNPSVIVIPSATVGFKRKDISVFTHAGTIERVAGIETDGEVVTSPDVPEGTLYYKSYDIDGDTIGVDPEPPAIDGSIYKKKIENTRYKSTLSGENIIIPFQAAGQSHYSVTNAALVSVAGFTTAGLTTPMYEGQDVIFENQTGHEITLKDSFGVDTSFVIGADLLVPNEGKLWFRFRNNELELIDKNWFEINEVATAQNLGEFIDSLDSKTDVKDTDEFVLSDSDDELKSKKTRFLDFKTKLKSYFDTLYLSLSVFNDFVTDVFDSLDNKLDKSSTPSSVYTTDAEGLQVMKPIREFLTPVGDYVTVNTTQTITGNKTFNDVGLIKKNQTYLFPDQSGGNFYIGDYGGYDKFEFNSLDGYDRDGYGFTQIYSNAEDGSGIVHNSLDGQVGSVLSINQYDTHLRNKYAGKNTTLYVDGQNRKVRIEGTPNQFADLGTSLINGTKNFEFPDQSGTLALLSDLSGFTTPSEVATQITTAINSNKTSFTHNILVSNWTLVYGKYEAVISNAGILANSFVDVIPSNDHVDIVRNAQIYPSVLISAGSVKVYSKYLPSDTITVTININ